MQQSVESGRKPGTVDVEVALQNLRASLLDGDPAAPASPLTAQRLAPLIALDDKIRASYATLYDRLFFGPETSTTIAPALTAKSRRIFAGLTALFADCAMQLVAQSNAKSLVPVLATRAFTAATEHLKWTAFEHMAPAGSFWLGLHGLLRAVEALGVAGQMVELRAGPAATRTNCTDAYVQCLLLGTLNVGVLEPMSIEIAHRWLVDMAKSRTLATLCDEKVHTHRVRLDTTRGAVRITDVAVPDEATRFLDGASLEPGLAETRKYLYSGALTAQARNPSAAALHYGAFLDLAERLWSTQWRRIIQRAPREAVRGVTVEAVIGLERIVAAIDAAQDDAPAGTPAALEIDWPAPRDGGSGSNVIDLPGRSAARWTLRDRNETGLVVVVPFAAAAALPVGALIGLREGDATNWSLGMLVRRIAADDAGECLLGIKRLSARPVHVRLVIGAATGAPPRQVDALFAPLQTKHARVDALIVPEAAFAATDDCSLRVAKDRYQIRIDRVLDRGDGWLRTGFEIVAKGHTQ